MEELALTRVASLAGDERGAGEGLAVGRGGVESARDLTEIKLNELKGKGGSHRCDLVRWRPAAVCETVCER